MDKFIGIVIVGAIIYFVYKKFKAKNENKKNSDSTVIQESNQGKIRKIKIDRKWRTVNDWSYLIEGAHGKKETMIDIIKRDLKEVDAPSLNIGYCKVSIAGLTGIFMKDREQLFIENKKLLGYNVLVSIEDYGKQLNVSWYLMIKENWLSRLTHLAMKNNLFMLFLAPILFVAKFFYSKRNCIIPELMDIFDIEELTAYSTTAHHAVTKATEEIMGQMDMDFSKVDTKSRGFLNIS